MSQDKQLEMLKFIVTTEAPTEQGFMKMKAYNKLCGMMMPAPK